MQDCTYVKSAGFQIEGLRRRAGDACMKCG